MGARMTRRDDPLASLGLSPATLEAMQSAAERLNRLSRIIGRLAGASELTLHRIETELGLVERPKGEDAGKPWEAKP